MIGYKARYPAGHRRPGSDLHIQRVTQASVYIYIQYLLILGKGYRIQGTTTVRAWLLGGELYYPYTVYFTAVKSAEEGILL